MAEVDGPPPTRAKCLVTASERLSSAPMRPTVRPTAFKGFGPHRQPTGRRQTTSPWCAQVRRVASELGLLSELASEIRSTIAACWRVLSRLVRVDNDGTVSSIDHPRRPSSTPVGGSVVDIS
jgi:hypothetical protein